MVYNTATGSMLADGPAHSVGLQPMLFVAGSDGRLQALHAGGLHCLDLDKSPPEDPYSYATTFEPDAGRWRWTRACSPLHLPSSPRTAHPPPLPRRPS